MFDTTLPQNEDIRPTVYFDVTGNSTPDSRPVGSINRARCPAEVASRKARINKAGGDCRR
jgi:hypothetical protein